LTFVRSRRANGLYRLLLPSPEGEAALSRKSVASDSRFPGRRKMLAARRYDRPL
jgi:hypothetical protein